MPENIVGSKSFQTALGYAKDIARKTKAEALQAGHMVAGFAVMVLRADAEAPEWLSNSKDKFLKYLEGIGIEPKDITTLPESEKLPVSQDLRQLISTRGSSVDQFCKALVEWLDRENVFELTAFQRILRRASAVATSAGANSVDAEAFCAGAYALYVNGEVKDWPLLSAIMGANAESLQAIVSARKFSLLGHDAAETLPIDEQFKTAVAKGEERREPLLRLLNVGLAIGADLLARERTAYHEAGHAVVSYVLRPRLTVTHITNVTEGDAAGATYYDRDSPFWSRITAEDVPIALCVALAGRASEQVKYGINQADDGAISDIESATRIGWRAISELGLYEDFGCIHLPFLTQKLGQPAGFLFDEAQRALQKMLKQASLDACATLEENWPLVEALAQALIIEGTINCDVLLMRLATKGLEGAANVVLAVSMPVEREVIFAQAAGLIITAEGPVRHLAGDAIVKDDRGHVWPVARSIFEKSYRPVGDATSDAGGLYQKIPGKVWAQKLTYARRLDMSGGRGILRGTQGDWLIDYGNGDLAIVNADMFSKTYKLEA